MKPVDRLRRMVGAAMVLAALSAGPVAAQLLGGLKLPLTTPQLEPGRLVSGVERDLSPQHLLDARALRLADFARAHRREVETDEAGDPVVRSQVLAIAPTAEALAAVEQAGFAILRHDVLEPLGVDVAVLAAPKGVSVRKALRRLQALDPAGSYDYDHLYFGSGAASAGDSGAASPAPAANSHARVGLIDTGVDAAAPTLAAARIQVRGFAPEAPSPAEHGTATASLIVGRAKGFSGAAAGATLWAADIYGRTEGGGSAESLARALAWMAEAKVPVVNVSLVGPDNRLLAASIKALQARGQLVVAAVGNDGPAAPPAYPASYPGVIAVSAVDGRGRPLPEAGRALHVDFCAPGADMAAAGPHGFVTVRGTSFAAPLVAGLLAERLETPDPGGARAAVETVAHDAKAANGDRKACGRGVVGAGLRTEPKAVGARPAVAP